MGSARGRSLPQLVVPSLCLSDVVLWQILNFDNPFLAVSSEGHEMSELQQNWVLSVHVHTNSPNQDDLFTTVNTIGSNDFIGNL